MRRKEKEIVNREDIEAIIRQSLVCRLAMTDGNSPYMVPLCFGYRDQKLYFHGADQGKKLDILKKNRQVCFEFDLTTGLKPGKSACDWGIGYKSVIGFGRAAVVEDRQAKREALDIIMAQYAEGRFDYSDTALDRTIVIRVDISSMSGKESR
jgi:nitroimidazol reductase NimA-like FMN-containing flavoprotein (pyridoxamine 5'-phosphate oxidase superfamily)